LPLRGASICLFNGFLSGLHPIHNTLSAALFRELAALVGRTIYMDTGISLTETIDTDLPLFKALHSQTVIFKTAALMADLSVRTLQKSAV